MIIFNSKNEEMKTSYNLKNKLYFKCRQIVHLIAKSLKKVLLKES